MKNDCIPLSRAFDFVHDYELNLFAQNETGKLSDKVMYSIAYGAAKRIYSKYNKYPVTFTNEDLIQEAFYKVFNTKYDSNRPKAQSIKFLSKSVYNYLLICVNDVIGNLRLKRKPDKRLSELAEKNIPCRKNCDPVYIVCSNERKKLITELIEREKDHVTRQIILEYYFNKNTYAEIAKKFSVTPERVRQRLFRFLENTERFVLANRKYREGLGIKNNLKQNAQ